MDESSVSALFFARAVSREYGSRQHSGRVSVRHTDHQQPRGHTSLRNLGQYFAYTAYSSTSHPNNQNMERSPLLQFEKLALIFGRGLSIVHVA
jgi:hypothetical protein